MPTDYLTCAGGLNQPCKNPYHSGIISEIGGHNKCPTGRRLMNGSAVVCKFCDGSRIPEGHGYRLNPAVVPIIFSKEDEGEQMDALSARYCDDCIAGLDAQERDEQIIVNDLSVPVLIVASEKEIKFYGGGAPYDVIRTISRRGYILEEEKSGPVSCHDGILLTRCTVRAALPDACQCDNNGWHQLDNMRAFKIGNSDKAICFVGPQCAIKAVEAGIRAEKGTAKEALERVLGHEVRTAVPQRPPRTGPGSNQTTTVQTASAVAICQQIMAGRFVKLASKEMNRDGKWQNGCACATNNATCCDGELRPTAEMFAITRRTANGNLQIFTICSTARAEAEAAGITVETAGEAFAKLGSGNPSSYNKGLRECFSFVTMANGVGERKRNCVGKKYTEPRKKAPTKPTIPSDRCKKCATAKKPCRNCREKAAEARKNKSAAGH